MSQAHAKLAHEWFELVWNRGDREAIDRLLAPHAVGHGLPDDRDPDAAIRDRDAFKAYYDRFRASFPDLRVEVEDLVSQDDRVAVRCTVRGTHAAAGAGMAPTNRPVEFAGMMFFRIQGGQIVEAWHSLDFQALTRQLAAPA